MEYLLQRQSLFSFITVFFLCAGGLLDFPRDIFRRLLLLLGVGNIGFSLLGIGFSGNLPQDACLVVLCLPLVYEEFRGYARMAGIATVVAFVAYAQSGTASIALLIGLMSLNSVALILGMIVLVAHSMFAQNFWLGHGRTEHWVEAVKFLKGIDVLYGAGPGSYFLYGPALALKDAQDGSPVFSWLHNDFLECLFGYGLIGVLLLSFLLVTALWFVRKRKRLRASLLIFIVIMCFQMPFEMPLFWFFIIYFLQGLDESKNLYFSGAENTNA